MTLLVRVQLGRGRNRYLKYLYCICIRIFSTSIPQCLCAAIAVWGGGRQACTHQPFALQPSLHSLPGWRFLLCAALLCSALLSSPLRCSPLLSSALLCATSSTCGTDSPLTARHAVCRRLLDGPCLDAARCVARCRAQYRFG